MLVSRLFTGSAKDRLTLIEAALEHDLVEAEIGDMPRPGRTEEHRKLEDQVAKDMGLRSVSAKLRPWLEWADLMEAGLYAQREMKLGNQHFEAISLRIASYIANNQRDIPSPLFEFAQKEGLL